jgi:hypothetical protein
MTRSAGSCARVAAALLLPAGLAPLARGQVFDYRVEGGSSDLAFGGAVSRIGDVDQDGCDDLVVGAPDSGASSGAVTILSGKTGAVLAHLNGTTTSQLGFAVDGRIDADGDGWPDVLIGAPGDSTSASMGGGVMIYSPHLNLTLVDIHSSTSNALLGSSVRALEDDLDGDGIDDFIAGAPVANTAYVFSGRNGNVIFTESGQSGSLFGWSVSLGGKLDGDKVADFVVGSPLYLSSAGKKSGRVVAYSGHDGSQLWAVNGAADSRFGQSLAHPGDLDGDGHGDLVVGAPFHLDANGMVKTGCVTVLSGATGAVLYKVFGDQAGDEFGDSVRGVGGDLDGDGTNDFVVGAPQLSGAQRGYARVISGASGATIFTLGEHGDPNGINFYGYAVAGGDFDGDGRTDVVVGGVAYNGGQGNVEVWTTAVARWNNYDTGYPGTLGVPTFTARNDPVVGGHLDLDLSNSLGATTAGLIVIGVSQASIPTGKGGRLLVDPLLFLAVSVPATGLTLSGSVPNDPALYGFDLDLQALELDVGAPLGLSFTPGLDLTFGYP